MTKEELILQIKIAEEEYRKAQERVAYFMLKKREASKKIDKEIYTLYIEKWTDIELQYSRKCMDLYTEDKKMKGIL